MKFKIYLSGPIFSEAEIKWAAKVKAAIEQQFGDAVEVMWPHEVASKAETKDEIFQANVKALDLCDVMVAILDGSQVDDGTAWEIGYFYSRSRKPGRIIGIRTDFRRSGEMEDSRVNAMVECSCATIVNGFDQLIIELERLMA